MNSALRAPGATLRQLLSAAALLMMGFGLSCNLLAADNQLLGWNNLGMHCMDSDYSVFSILPPYNTIEAQLLVAGRLVTNGMGYTVTYEATADLAGSFNSTSGNKGNFYDYSADLYGAALDPDAGLLQWPMPGTNNTPRAMLFEQTNQPAPGVAVRVNWFRAEGIPITPYDDAGKKNAYPLMRLVARNTSGTVLAENDVVLPVSDEMDCRACHASGSDPAAQPLAGWVWSENPERDYRLNILRLHDEYRFLADPDFYHAALLDRGFNSNGLYHGVVADGKAVLCAACHASEALGTRSYSNTPPLTSSVHLRHAWVMDPELNVILNTVSHRAACYRCHPGATTKCLRGAMGKAIAEDGSMAIQCQSCHGTMSQVGDSARVGWFMEPSCGSCHTGTAVNNNGQLRYTSAFHETGQPRMPVDATFTTNPDTPANGLSLYRFSAGHGGLQCSACHGSTHAEFPSSHQNDNRRNQALQGHAGVMVECTACHASLGVSATAASGGPHGLHPVGQDWADKHGDLVETNPQLRATCSKCHNSDGKGSVLSRMHTDRTILTHENKYGTRQYWRYQIVSCYDCHDGPNSTDPTTKAQAIALDVTTNTLNSASVLIPLAAEGSGTMSYRIISQPAHGSVGASNELAIYFPEPGFTGTDHFTFSAWNGFRDSTLGTCTISVAAGTASLGIKAVVSPDAAAGWPALFNALVRRTNTLAEITYDWTFGDGSPNSNAPQVSHVYTEPGTFTWTVTVRAGMATATASGTVLVTPGPVLNVSEANGLLILTWENGSFDAVLETSDLQRPVTWTAVEGVAQYGPQLVSLPVPISDDAKFFRLRKVY